MFVKKEIRTNWQEFWSSFVKKGATYRTKALMFHLINIFKTLKDVREEVYTLVSVTKQNHTMVNVSLSQTIPETLRTKESTKPTRHGLYRSFHSQIKSTAGVL